MMQVLKQIFVGAILFVAQMEKLKAQVGSNGNINKILNKKYEN